MELSAFYRMLILLDSAENYNRSETEDPAKAAIDFIRGLDARRDHLSEFDKQNLEIFAAFLA